MSEEGELKRSGSAYSHNKLSDSDWFIVVMALVLIFGMAARAPIDGDMWWHLRAGQETLIQKAPLLRDVFSYTRAGMPWVNHSWLAQVGMAFIFQWLGFSGLSVAVAVLATGSLVFVLLQMEGPAILKAFLLIFGGVVSAPVWSPRPQTISLLLMAITGYVLYLYKWRQLNRVWVLPLIMLVWSNLHGGYALGFLVMLAMLAGEVLNHGLGYHDPWVLSWKDVRILLAWTMVSCLAVLINPNGLDTWLIPFQTVNVSVLQSFISEWASPDFHQLAQQPLLWLTFALLAAVGWSGRRLDGSDLLAVSGFGMMAYISRRHFGPFALVALPVLGRHLWPALQQWYQRVSLPENLTKAIRAGQAKGRVNRSWLQRGMNLLVVGLFGLIAAGKVVVVSHPAMMAGYLQRVYPVQAVQWLERNPLPGYGLNEYNWGGYQEWFLRDVPVFVDGRTDLFGDEIIGQWLELVQGGPDWQRDLDAWHIRWVLLEPERPLAGLLEEAGWQVRYRDLQAVILSR